MSDFNENFYKMCIALGVVDQLIQSGYMVDANTLSGKGAEQVVKAFVTEELDWVEEYRKLFSKNSTGKSGLMSDKISVSNKLKRFILQFGYSKEKILLATKNYITEMKGTPEFIQEADYFIFKRDNKKNEERSKLAAWCELDQTEFTLPNEVI